jgi:hypothetical protein
MQAYESSEREIRIASAPEHAKVIIGGRGTKESKVGGWVMNRLGEAIEQIGSSGQPSSERKARSRTTRSA